MTVYKRCYSIKNRVTFKKVYARGETFTTDHLVMKCLRIPQSDLPHLDKPYKKFGIVTSKKLDNRTVIQHRIRRIIAEVIRLRLAQFTEGWYIVIIPRRNVVENRKVTINGYIIGAEIDTFLSEVAVIRSGEA